MFLENIKVKSSFAFKMLYIVSESENNDCRVRNPSSIKMAVVGKLKCFSYALRAVIVITFFQLGNIIDKETIIAATKPSRPKKANYILH